MENIVKRTTLIVRDIEKSLAFYRDALGFSVYYDDEVVLTGRGIQAGKKGDKTHLIIMKAKDPVIGMIGLLQFVDPPLPTPAEIPKRVGIGDIALVFQTDDIDEVYRRVQEHDVHIAEPPHPFEVRGADGTMLQMSSMAFFDPDGYFIELNQRH